MEEKPVSLQSDEMRPVLAWKDAIEDNLPPAAGKEFASSWSSKRVKDPARVYGRMVAWQLEDPVYGLKNLASVRKDKDPLSFLEEISVMHKKEAQGMPVSQEEFQELGERVLEAWAFKGEQKKKERAIQTAMNGCLHEKGYEIAGWERVRKSPAARKDIASAN